MKWIVVLSVFILGLAAAVDAQGVAPDSLTVEQVIRLTLASHPTVRQAEYALTASAATTEAARSQNYPDITINGDYTRIGPVPEFELPGQGKIGLAPYNNFDLSLEVRQTLYDFGKRRETVRVAETARQTASDNIERSRFTLAYQAENVFYAILILERRIAVLDEQITTLQQHADLTARKLAAGTATDFDTLTIQVRIATARSDRIDAARALDRQEILLRQLTGLSSDTPLHLIGSFASQTNRLPSSDSLLETALRQRPEIVLARDVEQTAAARLRLTSLTDRPKLSLFATTGFKNGYEPNLNTLRGNYTAGVAVKVPVFNGHRTKHQTAAADAELNVARAHTAALEREVRSEVRQAIVGVTSSQDKILNSEAQVRQAEEAVSQARVKYDAGVITNLDLLDAETTLSESKLIRLRAYYDYTVSLTALDRATGKKIW